VVGWVGDVVVYGLRFGFGFGFGLSFLFWWW
jgi:hypothetical protein